MSLKAKRKLQKHLDTDTAVWTGLGLIRSADQQATSFFRVMMSLTVRLFSFGTLCLEHLRSPGLSPRPLCCFLHTVQDLAMLCRFADDTVSSNKKGRVAAAALGGMAAGLPLGASVLRGRPGRV